MYPVIFILTNVLQCFVSKSVILNLSVARAISVRLCRYTFILTYTGQCRIFRDAYARALYCRADRSWLVWWDYNWQLASVSVTTLSDNNMRDNNLKHTSIFVSFISILPHFIISTGCLKENREYGYLKKLYCASGFHICIKRLPLFSEIVTAPTQLQHELGVTT